MTKSFGVFTVLALALSMAAFGQVIDPDPVGFCAPAGDCFTGAGLGGETIPVGTTTFQMEKNGADKSTSTDPWYLLVAVPDGIGGAPVITSTDFTEIGSPVPKGQLLQTTPSGTSIYDIAGVGGDTNNSMNAPNLFCDGAAIPCATSNEINAHGSLPTFFEVYLYSFTPSFVGGFTPYIFNVAGSGLVGGTYLAASGGSPPFSTPFTTTGLAYTSTSSSSSSQGSPESGPEVPEPNSIVLLGTALLAAGTVLRKKLVRH
jgi:hypothetical protein